MPRRGLRSCGPVPRPRSSRSRESARRAVLGAASGDAVGAEIAELVVALAPYMVVSIVLSVTFPLVFVAGLGRRLPLVGLVVVAVHVPRDRRAAPRRALGPGSRARGPNALAAAWLLHLLHAFVPTVRGLAAAVAVVVVVFAVALVPATLVDQRRARRGSRPRARSCPRCSCTPESSSRRGATSGSSRGGAGRDRRADLERSRGHARLPASLADATSFAVRRPRGQQLGRRHVRAVGEAFPDVRVIPLDENRGFAAASTWAAHCSRRRSRACPAPQQRREGRAGFRAARRGSGGNPERLQRAPRCSGVAHDRGQAAHACRDAPGCHRRAVRTGPRMARARRWVRGTSRSSSRAASLTMVLRPCALRRGRVPLRPRPRPRRGADRRDRPIQGRQHVHHGQCDDRRLEPRLLRPPRRSLATTCKGRISTASQGPRSAAMGSTEPGPVSSSATHAQSSYRSRRSTSCSSTATTPMRALRAI